MRLLWLICLVLAVTFVTVIQANEPHTPDAAEAQLMELGLSVYRESYCGVCHVFTAAGTKGAFGPSHDGFAVTAAARILDPAYTGNATTAEGYVRESILDPLAFVVPGYHATPHRMPAYEQLTEEELSALIYALLHAEPAP